MSVVFEVNFEKFVVGLHFIIISSMFEKFLSDWRPITILSIKCLKLMFLYFKIIHKRLVYILNSKQHLINIKFDVILNDI